jgi:hypothetical protein
VVVGFAEGADVREATFVPVECAEGADEIEAALDGPVPTSHRIFVVVSSI